MKINWQWAAAVYPNPHFSLDYNAIEIKPVTMPDTRNFKPYVIAGATGGGGSNYTRGLSGTAAVGPCRP